jgi:hypothetical protein
LIFAPELPLSVGFLPVFSPPKGAAECFESIACHPQSISRRTPLRSTRPSSLSASRRRPCSSTSGSVHGRRLRRPRTNRDGWPSTGIRPKHVPDGIESLSAAATPQLRRPTLWVFSKIRMSDRAAICSAESTLVLAAASIEVGEEQGLSLLS